MVLQKSSPGFSLIEVLVAMALMGVALLPLFRLHQASLDSALRAERSTQRSQTEANALALLSAINPSLRPKGSAELAPYTMTWNAIVIAGPTQAAGRPFEDGRFALALFDVAIEIKDSAGETISKFTARRVGYVPTRAAARLQPQEP